MKRNPLSQPVTRRGFIQRVAAALSVALVAAGRPAPPPPGPGWKGRRQAHRRPFDRARARMVGRACGESAAKSRFSGVPDQ